MPKQSATNPRIKCNGCKDYHSAPKQDVHYQCVVHGYLCDKNLIPKNHQIEFWTGWETLPNSYQGKCAVMKSAAMRKKLENGDLDKDEFDENCCLNDVIKYNWHNDVNRWIEKGKEEEEKAKAKSKVKSKTKPDYLKEINVLVDLLEDDTLTKEVFIKKIREKLN